ncbi:type III polyketide synthase [Verrucomicrobium sp. BvORR106]|uniref:type III polyketide synthase n=1 Tax=Verrucomicrobium sp. BvORR106 TaxID=1403819 RepID=UPI0007C66C16|nr:type III polyketide synthase [Verrucomicrobium sp. BvORR106]
MSAYIHQICTQVPEFTYSQAYIRDRLKEWAPEQRTRRLIHAMYNRSGIETRHSVIGDFMEGHDPELYKTTSEGALISPSTAERNTYYTRASRTLAVQLARKVFATTSDFVPQEVTHIVFASCTGFANPGPDYHIIRELGLPESVQRYTLGFMGCYAAFPALRMAAQFCEADPKAVVLVMCLELCSLHMQINDQPDCILANSLFADGAAAALVSSRNPSPDRPAYRVLGFASALVTDGEADMAWDIGNEGFNIVLSSYVPEILGTRVRPLLEDVLQRGGLTLPQVEEWAVHPGGRAILDKVQDGLGLSPDSLLASRHVLRDYGNMSSATIFFVLKELLDSADEGRALTCAMAFGPGLTVETAMLERCGCTVTAPRTEVTCPSPDLTVA